MTTFFFSPDEWSGEYSDELQKRLEALAAWLDAELADAYGYCRFQKCRNDLDAWRAKSCQHAKGSGPVAWLAKWATIEHEHARNFRAYLTSCIVGKRKGMLGKLLAEERRRAKYEAECARQTFTVVYGDSAEGEEPEFDVAAPGQDSTANAALLAVTWQKLGLDSNPVFRGLLDGKTQAELASEADVSQATISRQIASWREAAA